MKAIRFHFWGVTRGSRWCKQWRMPLSAYLMRSVSSRLEKWITSEWSIWIINAKKRHIHIHGFTEKLYVMRGINQRRKGGWCSFIAYDINFRKLGSETSVLMRIVSFIRRWMGGRHANIMLANRLKIVFIPLKMLSTHVGVLFNERFNAINIHRTICPSVGCEKRGFSPMKMLFACHGVKLVSLELHKHFDIR